MSVDLEQRILAFLAQPEEALFASLALEVFTWQRRENPALTAYCRTLGLPEQLDNWSQIPGLPQEVFKLADVRSFPAGQIRYEFRTSGTTGEGFGRHLLPSLQLYEAAVRHGWEHGKMPRSEVLLLMPATREMPFSSLSRMGAFLTGGPAAGKESSTYVLADGRLDYAGLRQALAQRSRPIVLFGTALAFLHLLESKAGPGPLPKGSVILETGGFKGSGREISKREFYCELAAHFDIPEQAIWNEYGMTELSSQFYSCGVGQSHFGPPWTRFLVIDPVTNQPAPLGQIGLLRLIDLANLWSVISLQTRDLAVAQADGGFLLLGRDPAALPRGCSRAADELLTLARS